MASGLPRRLRHRESVLTWTHLLLSIKLTNSSFGPRYLAVLLSIAYIIVAIVAASRLDKSAMPTSKPIGFAVIW